MYNTLVQNTLLCCHIFQEFRTKRKQLIKHLIKLFHATTKVTSHFAMRLCNLTHDAYIIGGTFFSVY